MKSHSTKVRYSIGLSVALMIGLLIFLPGRAWGEPGTSQLMDRVYQKLADLEGYAFSATVHQTTHPLPVVANVGLSSQTSSILVVGSIDKPADLIQLNISEQSGFLLDGMGQFDLKLQAGEVWGRVGGQAWEQLDDAATPDQNTSDPAAFLQATRNVQLMGTEERLGQSYEVYSFELDGAAWAQLMRQQLQADLIRRGELAPGETLDTLEYYEKMTGQGELWLNESGLPQRLTFHAVYPPLPNETEYKEVETITDYSQWKGLDPSASGTIWPGWDNLGANVAQGLPKAAAQLPTLSAMTLLALLVLLFPVLIVRYRRSLMLYRVLGLILVGLFVAQPVLNASSAQVTSDRRTDRTSVALARQAENKQIQTAVDKVKADFASHFDMTQGLAANLTGANLAGADNLANALAAGVGSQLDPANSLPPAGSVGVDTDGDGISDAQERELGTNAAATDSDGDGVDDASEVILGLDPANPDTDGDLLSDGFELAGIQMGGKTWYLDPLSKDTNGDSIPDSLECIQAIDVVVSPSGKGVKGAPKGTGICDDTDGDGIPDFADDDNDNDGVNDWIDGQADSRFGNMTTGVKDSTFTYGLDNYSSGKPLRVTFELRPTDPQHLWYSMNVLDWPSGDYEGQIKRVHDTKLGTTGAEANGDMQLVPMIEVLLPGDEAIHLPTIPGKAPIVGDNARLAEWLDMDVLQRYQMAVSWTADKQSIQVYLPATLIRDTKGNAPVNFVGKMLYWPNGSGLFSKNHTARLVWLVQMDVDNCVVPEGSIFTYQNSCLSEGSNYNNGINWKTTQKKLVHRYYDSFFLTAFTAEEDLSANGQIFYENPAQVSNLATYVPDQLLGLGTVLESYMRQKKSPTEALQAYKTKGPNIGSRLTSGSVIQDPDTYGLMSKIATQAAPGLLDTVFKPFKDQLPYPTMLYVTWGESKVTGLAGVSSGDALRLNMSNAAQKSATNIRLGAFTYNANPATVGGKQNPNWDSADPGKIWTNYLQGRSIASYQQLPQNAQQKFTADQFQQATLSIFWNLSRGINLNTDLTKSLTESLGNTTGLVDELGAGFDNAGENAIGALISVFDDFKEANAKVAGASLKTLVGGDVKNVANAKNALKTAKWAKGYGQASVTFAAASATLSVVLALKDQLGLSEDTVTVLEAVNATIGAVMSTLQVTQEVAKYFQAVHTLEKGKSALAIESTMGTAGALAAVIVAALILVTSLVIFFKLLGDGDAVAAKTALAQGVATAMVVLLLFVISTLFPIGTAIALLLGLVDGLIAAWCKIQNWRESANNQTGPNYEKRKPWCSGYTSKIVGAFGSTFYKSVPMVDMKYGNRLQFGQTDTKPISVNGLVGLNAGNRMQVIQPMTTTVRLPDDHSLEGSNILIDGTFGGAITAGLGKKLPLMPLSEYDRLIKQKNIFNYELITATDAKADDDLAGRTTPDQWKNVLQVDQPTNRLYKIESPTTQITLSAGINWNPDLFVREYYSYSLAECGIFAGGCDYKFDQFDKVKADTQVITIGTNLIYDVFPLNLTAFYTLEQVQESGQFVNKYRLAWGGSKLPFPTLLDADGDGLRGDLDPDDKTADTDNDGLPDAFEVQDFRLNARSADSDSDGLSDYQEMRRGTRPDRADSDGDGLSDNDESTGWELVYVDAANVTKRTWVTSDPLVFDTDGDGISDQQERVLGTHPRAKNTGLSVLSIRTSTSTNQTGSLYLAPSQTIAFTSTVRNDLRKPVAYGLLEAEVLSSTQVINPITFELQPQQGKDLTGSIAAPAQSVASSEEIILRNRAGANMVDPSASYADQLRGLAQPNGLKFQLNFEQRPADERNFKDVTGNATLTCPNDYCPSVIRSTDSYGTFQASNWYAATGNNLAFTQPRFGLGGWVTAEKPFGGKYNERVLFGPDNVAGGTEKYLQLSLVDMQSDTPKAKINFTATDGAVCEQVLTGLTVPFGQKTHVFVTYDGTLVHGYKNGQLVGSYNLQNCTNKVPAGNRFTIGRGTTSATLYVNNVYYRLLDEGGGWFTSAEPYLQLNDTKDPFARTDGIKNDRTWNVGKELTLRDASTGDANSTVYLCEEDNGDKEGACVSKSIVDSDDALGTVTIDPRRNGSFNTGWSDPFPVPFGSSGNLNYNVQNNFFQGALDDLRIYEATLTPQEVGQLINGSGLTFQLDEASGRTQFRNAGVDATQLTCPAGACPASGLKGYSGQAVRFGAGSETLAVDKLRERFGSNFVTSFWFKPEAGTTSATPTPLVRFGQGKEGFTLFATNSDTQTTLRARFNETQIDTIGGSGGNDYSLRCNGDEALVGIFGRAGGGIDQVGPVCMTTNSSYQWLGAPTRRGSAGGNGGGDYERLCPSGSFVSGFTGRSGGLVDRIQLTCARPIDFVSAIDSRNSITLDGVGGSGGGDQSPRVCPSNLPANGIVGRAGGLVDSFGLTCQEQVSTQSDFFFLPANQWSHVALAQNNDSLLLYVNGQPVQNIWYGTSSRTSYRLTGSYSPDLVLGGGAKGLMDEVQIQGLSVNGAKTASIGGSGGGAFELSCQVNEALVGLFGRSGGAVDQVGPVCATIDQNSQRVGNTARRGSAGGNGGGDFERICAANSALVGFQGRAGGGVDQLRPICAPFKANGVIDTAASTTELSGVGGGGGSEQGLKICGAGVPATGIFGRAGGAVDAFGLQCSMLLHESVRKPFTDSAQVYLALDEVAGITTFVNSTGKGNLICGAGVTCPQGGLKGQVRESLQFNNQPGMATSATPRLTVANQPDAPFSFSTWVKLTAAPAAPASLVALHANEGTDAPAWRFQLTNSGGQVVPQLTGSLFSGGSCSGSFTVTPANVNLALNQWHQLGVNYDSNNGKNDVSIFLNGRLIHQERVSGLLCRTGTTLRFGQSYRGQMDEFFFYNKSLEVSEFLSQFVYQSTWYDVISTERFRVDYNAPTLKLTLGAGVKLGTNIFGVVASDTESGIRSVEYKDKDGVWKPANAESATTGVWAFGLDIQGATLIEVRATDKVGNIKTDSKNVVVDSTQPTVTLTTRGPQKSLTIQGTASDSGSGLQSATVMLIDPLGAPMGSPRGVAVVNSAWQYSQELPPVVNGTFQVWMSAIDQLGNEFKGVVGTVQVDNSPPTPGLIVNRSDYTGVGANLPVLKGYVTDQPYPEGLRLFIGFEDVAAGSTVGGSVPSTVDLSGNQWQALPVTGTTGPTVIAEDPYRRADFQLGQTLVITNANPQLGAQRSLNLNPNSQTLMAWIKPASLNPSEQKILVQNDQAGFGILLKGNQVTLRINRNGTPIDKDTGLRAVNKEWQHLVVSFDQIGQSQQAGQTVTVWLGMVNQNPTRIQIALSAAERINPSSSPLTVGAVTNGYFGEIDDIILYSRPFSDLEARQLANSSFSTIQKVEVGFLHRKDKDDATKVVWQNAILDRPNVDRTTWQLQAPADLEGIYDISLRASDALGNQRILAGVWTGLIDTQAPRIVLGGTTPGQQSCAVTDFSLSTGTFLCGNVANATGAASALYATGVFTSAGLTWDAQWFKDLYRGRVVADRLYSLYQTGANFTSNTVAKSCDIYGNCTQCTVTANNVNAPVCTVSSGSTLLRAAGVEDEHENLFDNTALIGPGIFTTTLVYERPDAYVPGEEPGAPTSEWVTIDEPYILIDDAVLASTRPFAGDFTEAQTEIEWGESISATEYYVGWTLTETAEIADLTFYATPDIHTQSLADKGRYYAHVIAVDADGETNAFTMGPVYFDGATPASYLNWDEFGPGQPYWLWQDALSATGQACNVLGQDDRAALFSGGASARSGLQTLYGTWNNEWLALHWNGVNLETQGDLHLYIDSKAGGSLYAYDPYAPIAQATSLVVMAERRQYQSNAVDRMLADFAVIVEDAQTVRLMQWNGSSWQNAPLGQVKFSYADGEAIVWLSLAALGVNPNAMDVSLVGFITEENSMQVWATMPGNNPLNSPSMLPSHEPAALDPSRTLLNLQTSMRLSADSNVNNTLDNCPTNVIFDQSILDVTFTADPAAEIYDQVVYDGIRAVVPDDVESLLASLCAGVSDTSQSPVCQLAQQVADNAGGGGPEVGPFDMLPANAGPGDTLTFYATVRNLSNQETGDLTLEVEGDLPSNGTTLAVGFLAPLESKVISFTETVDPGASYDFTVMTIYPVETVENDEESITLTYEHEPHTVIHDIDRSAPISAELTSLLIDDLIGGGEQLLEGLVFDQSPLTQVTLQTSLGETVNCDDTLQVDAFASDWACAINVPESTPDGTMVQVSLSAEDIYGFASGVIGQWTLEVDNLAPELTVFGEPGLSAAGVQASANTTETLLLEGLAGDERWLGGVQVCDTLQGHETCQEAEMSFFSDIPANTVGRAALSINLADEAAWSLGRVVDTGIEGTSVPFTITAYDAAGNGAQQNLLLLIDTLAPTVTLSAQPVTQITFDGAFALSGNATDRAGVSYMELEALDPLGEYSYYPIDLTSPDAVNTGWHYQLSLGTTEFAMPGEYTYVILAYDALGNETEVGPFTLSVGEPAQPWLNAPIFGTTSNDLWTGFAPGAQLYMRVQFDDDDLSLGDAITVTVDPLPAWLVMTRIDERTVEISGTVPLTITQVVLPPANLDLSTQEVDENDSTTVITNVLQINVGMTLTDKTGKQAYQSWIYEQVLDSTPTQLFFPLIFKQSAIQP